MGMGRAAETIEDLGSAMIQSAADCGEYREAARAIAEGLIAAFQFFGRSAVSVHNALNRVIASRAGKNL